MENEKLTISRHSLAHVMAKAVKKLYPNAKLGIGPAIENGFYYDFDVELKPEDLPKIEKEMKAIINNNQVFKREVLSREDAKKLFKDEPYKIQLIEELPENEEISVYYLNNDYVDLCRGPHVENTSKLQNMAYKLDRISGAYWKGSEKNKMLSRIYAYAFATKQELSEYVTMLEEAKKRDHRKLGKDLGLFFISDFAPGCPFYMPKGLILKNVLIDFWRKMHKEAGYIEIETPIILNRKLWEVSGHWDHYKQNMYSFSTKDEEFAIKPMNCPGGMLFYKESMHSYKDFPLRVAELGKVHRHEASGTLHGLMRVRSFTQDDAHIFMLPEQIESEVKGVIDLVDKMYGVFGLTYHLELSTMPESHIGEKADWDKAEDALKNALKLIGKDYIINEGDGAFYGPKIDIHIKDAIGRTWQCGTIQLDMQLPKRFELEYVDSDGSKKEPVMIHRVIYGSIDRFIGILTENYAGAFPTWLSPVQVKVLNISENSKAYAEKVAKQLEAEGLRVEADLRNESIGKKIREAQIEKTPYTLVVGDKEMEAGAVAVRKRAVGEIGTIKVEDFIKDILNEIKL